MADSLEEAGERLFAFTRLDPSQWKSARTTNAIERLNEEFRRRIKTQTVLPCAETVPMLLSPGGFHGMLMDLVAPLKEGDRFPVTLSFRQGGSVTIDAQVQSIRSKADECAGAQ